MANFFDYILGQGKYGDDQPANPATGYTPGDQRSAFFTSLANTVGGLVEARNLSGADRANMMASIPGRMQSGQEGLRLMTEQRRADTSQSERDAFADALSPEQRILFRDAPELFFQQRHRPPEKLTGKPYEYDYAMAQREANGEPRISYGQWKKEDALIGKPVGAKLTGKPYEYDYAMAQRVANGEPRISYEQWKKEDALLGNRASGNKIQIINGQPYLVQENGTLQLLDVPKTPAQIKEAETEAVQKDAAQKKKLAGIQTVIGAMDELKTKIEKEYMPLVGYGHSMLDWWFSPWQQDLRDVDGFVTTIKANVGFDTLQALRDASKTGGALGNVSELELRQLNAAFGSLDVKQSKGVFLKNLEVLRKIYTTDLALRLRNAVDNLNTDQPGVAPQSAGGIPSLDAINAEIKKRKGPSK